MSIDAGSIPLNIAVPTPGCRLNCAAILAFLFLQFACSLLQTLRGYKPKYRGRYERFAAEADVFETGTGVNFQSRAHHALYRTGTKRAINLAW